MSRFFNTLPGPEELIKRHGSLKEIPEVNGHLHSPYSFCSFDSIKQMFGMAVEEKVRLLGINDFYTVDGYGEFEKHALGAGVFPLFNIEFMGLMADLQAEDVRINDPSNPGRVYFSGKGLKQPFSVSPENRDFLSRLQANSQEQVREMCRLTDALLKEINAPFSIRYEEVKTKYAENLVRERHIARAIREAAYTHFINPGERKVFFEKLFEGRPLSSAPDNIQDVENEIRSNILKKGGKAFVPEDGDAFPDLQKIIDFILDAGGIPCYPVLLDDKAGNITQFESDWEKMDEILRSYNVSCLELIPQRNTLEKLTEFVGFFLKKNYLICFGTEHNTPGVFPVTVTVEKDRELTRELREVSYRGASVIAAHQYLTARNGKGFIGEDKKADLEKLDYYRELGHAVITAFTLSN